MKKAVFFNFLVSVSAYCLHLNLAYCNPVEGNEMSFKAGYYDDSLKTKNIEIKTSKYLNSDSVLSVSTFENNKISIYREYYSNGKLKISGTFAAISEDSITNYNSKIAIHNGIGFFELIDETEPVRSFLLMEE